MSSPARIAIVGAGPSGLFLAQALRRALPLAEIDVIDRLLTPYGLIRYGVACDHQGVKAISRQFDRLFEREGVQFFGGIKVGETVSLEQLRAMYHVVALASGLASDRRLGIPGDDLPGVVGSGRLTRWINSHPDEAGFVPPLGQRIVVIGAGNVALDVARLLAKSDEELAGSDMCPARQAHLMRAEVRSIDIVARGGLNDVRFEASMVREFGRLGRAHVQVLSEGAVPAHAAAQALVEINGTGAPAATADLRLTFRFGQAPQAILGNGKVEGVAFSGLTLPADTVITAIGFQADESSVRGSTDGPVEARLAEGLYAAGWFRRGPRGTIPENRNDSKDVADIIVADLPALTMIDKPGRAALQTEIGGQAFTYEHWRKVDAAEKEAAGPGRARRKFDDPNEMRAAAR